MEEVFEYIFFTSYFAGFLWIIGGAWIIRFITQYPAENKLSQGGDMKGWAGGIGAILLGLTIIVFKLLGKL